MNCHCRHTHGRMSDFSRSALSVTKISITIVHLALLGKKFKFFSRTPKFSFSVFVKERSCCYAGYSELESFLAHWHFQKMTTKSGSCQLIFCPQTCESQIKVINKQV